MEEIIIKHENQIDEDLIYSHIQLKTFGYIPNKIFQMTNLIMLKICFIDLTNCPNDIGKLVNLEYLDCSYNNLFDLPFEIGNLVKLKYFDCSHNQIELLIPEIGLCVLLEYLSCFSNNLVCLPNEIGNLTNLKKMTCSYNNLIELPYEIGNLINLESLDCSNNHLIDLPFSMGYLNRIQEFVYHGNHFESLLPNVKRWMDRLNDQNNNIFNDKQNVHDVYIQQSIRNSIVNILNDNFDNFVDFDCIDDLKKSDLSDEIKNIIIGFIKDDTNVHVTLNITFGELFNAVWKRIIKHENKFQILRILEQEMKDSVNECFIGRISRLVNCLSGFYDDIQVTIGRKDEISNIILAVRNRLDVNDPNYVFEWKRQVTDEMLERNFTQDEIDEWTSFIL